MSEREVTINCKVDMAKDIHELIGPCTQGFWTLSSVQWETRKNFALRNDKIHFMLFKDSSCCAEELLGERTREEARRPIRKPVTPVREARYGRFRAAPEKTRQLKGHFGVKVKESW